MSRSACFVTPSYARDFERCRLLSDSLAACAPGLTHYIIVDPHDLPLFRALAGARTVIVDARELLDPSFLKAPGKNGWWLSLRSPPIRGWITQQLRKLAMPRIVDADILLNVDSDVVFTRPFALETMLRDDRLSLFEVDYRNDEIVEWARIAAGLLGSQTPEPVYGYVGMLISWWREQLVAMTDRIEREQGMPWQRALARKRSFSEYMTYGGYIRSVAGIAAARHFPDARMLVQTSWHKPTAGEADLDALFRGAPSEAVAVMVHSKDDIDAAAYRRFAERAWRDAA